MKTIFVVCLILASILIISCGSKLNRSFKEYKSNNSYTPATSYSKETPASINEPKISIDRKIIKNADLSVEVYDFYKYREFIDSIINVSNAYISNEVQNNLKIKISRNISIKVLAVNFDFLIRQLENNVISREYKNIEADDVIEKYIDINSRIKSKKKVEQRYLNC